MAGTWGGDAKAGIEPFDAIELELAGLWNADVARHVARFETDYRFVAPR